MVVLDAPAPVDVLLPGAARLRVVRRLAAVPDDCLPALVDAEAGWPALPAAAALSQLVVARVVRVVAPQQVHEPRFAVVPESPCAHSAPERAPVQETRVEAEAAGSRPLVGSPPSRAVLQLLAGQLPSHSAGPVAPECCGPREHSRSLADSLWPGWLEPDARSRRSHVKLP